MDHTDRQIVAPNAATPVEETAMPIDLVPPAEAAPLSAPAAPLVAASSPSAAAQDYAAKSRAKNTKRAYKADWADFTAWCVVRGLDSLPATPTTVGVYLS